MEFRPLGSTGLDLSVLSFGASSLGQEFRSVDLDEALRGENFFTNYVIDICLN